MRYQPNHAPLGSRTLISGLTPGERKRLASDWSEIEVARDETMRNTIDDAREVFWETNSYDVNVALKAGQLIWDFLKNRRTWWAFRLDVLRDEFEVGEDITVDHPRLVSSGAEDFLVVAKTSVPTRRGVDVIAIS
jgi:hypothetical protein